MSIMIHTQNKQGGFTMIELIVSMGVFLVVAMISATAIISLMGGNRRAQAAKSAINNVNLAIDSISRTIRTGTDYKCDGGELECFNISGAPNRQITFISTEGENVGYGFNPTYHGNGIGAITRKIGAGPILPITAPNVDIENAIFAVGRSVGGFIEGQPRVLIIIRGKAGTGDEEVAFDVQTTVTQRIIEIE